MTGIAENLASRTMASQDFANARTVQPTCGALGSKQYVRCLQDDIVNDL